MPVDEKYFNWLYEHVRPEISPELSQYTKVCVVAHQIIFDWSVPNDDNRSAEGRELRREFCESLDRSSRPDGDWMALDASIFEVLVALARRCDFIVEQGLPWWFEVFMDNLELDHYHDGVWMPSDRSRVNRMLTKFNERRYKPNGRGGLFPLQNPKKDQREVELWYQMSAYMAENKMY